MLLQLDQECKDIDIDEMDTMIQQERIDNKRDILSINTSLVQDEQEQEEEEEEEQNMMIQSTTTTTTTMISRVSNQRWFQFIYGHHYGPFITLLVVFLFSAIMNTITKSKTFFFIQVLSLWAIGVSVHEFGHAIVAVIGGDTTIKEKGYLSLNPFATINRYFTIIIPILLISFGGVSMGLPSGSIDFDETKLYIRSPYWVSAVGMGGMAMSFFFSLLLSSPFWSGYYAIVVGLQESYFLFALACSVYLEVQSILFNCIPLPPLDTYIALSPFLPQIVRNFYRTHAQKLDVGCLLVCSVVLYQWGDFLWDFTPAITSDLFEIPNHYIHQALNIFYIPTLFGSVPPPN
ncbi:hypothetical protein DFA_07324 [Cavenderia fasciculata]|uniref:Peptidase M50 family protein n=1 Tax=Cavenderia fasciculata TaxID=261658 RepID=F4PW40_CACFS|nr:uncharacterized protein DFA_07324 [Cavenderia fasciculata]EGG20204.1 hypothetical protein DFA_07324 [Cavenderia fasciculata]|eukprot:XP_004367187.1 hypothetical protein DFA_07324 [Cavenderia fasciculata]